MNKVHNPTCLITGKNDNLQMFPLRDRDENMIGWIFLHQSIKPDMITGTMGDEGKIEWDFRVVNTNPKEENHE